MRGDLYYRDELGKLPGGLRSEETRNPRLAAGLGFGSGHLLMARLCRGGICGDTRSARAVLCNLGAFWPLEKVSESGVPAPGTKFALLLGAPGTMSASR